MRGKEFKLELNSNFTVSIGTVNTKNPKSIYIAISGWYEPKTDADIDYSKVIANTHKNIRRSIFVNTESSIFKQRYIMSDLDMRESGIKFNKRSYMCCEITLFQKGELVDLMSDTMIDNLKNIIEPIITDIFEINENFIFHKTK